MNGLTEEQLTKASEKMSSVVRGLPQVKYEIVKENEDSHSIKVELSAPLPNGVKLPTVLMGLPVHVSLGGEPVEGKKEVEPIEPVAPAAGSEVSSMVAPEKLEASEDKAIFEGGSSEVAERRAARQKRAGQE